MEERVSDSEDEEKISLKPSLISKEKAQAAILLVPHARREKLFHTLEKGNYSTLLPYGSLGLSSDDDLRSETSERTVNEDGNDRIDFSTSSESEASDSESEIERLIEFRHPKKRAVNKIDSSDSEPDGENLSNIDTSRQQNVAIDVDADAESSSRRGLRKRKFTSTHPYIADQAHWLGLCTVDYLNEMYQENPNLDVIIKLLNRIYQDNKKKFPHEEKYKAASFYAFLGKKNEAKGLPEARDDEKDAEDSYSEDDPNREALDLCYLQFQSSDEDNFGGLLDNISTKSSLPSPSGRPMGDSRIITQGTSSKRKKKTQGRRLEKSTHDSPFGLQMRPSKGPLSDTLSIELPTRESLQSIDFKRAGTPEIYEVSSPQSDENRSNEYSNDVLDSLVNQDVFSESSPSSQRSEDGYDSDVLALDKPLGRFHLTLNEFDQPLASLASQRVRIGDHDQQSADEFDYVNPQFSSRSCNRRKHKNSTLFNGSSYIRSLSDKKSSSNSEKRYRESRPPYSKMKSRLTQGHITNGHRELKRKKINRRDADKPKRRKSVLSENNSFSFSHNEAQSLFLKKSYYYLRAPKAFTTTIEGDSKRKFIIPRVTDIGQSYPNLNAHIFNSLDILNLLRHTTFDNKILRKIDISRIHKIKLGEVPLFEIDSLQINLLGRSFRFSLVSKDQSNLTFENVLDSLGLLIYKDSSLVQLHIVEEVVQSVCGIVSWLLNVQDIPSTKSWDSLEFILGRLFQHSKQQNKVAEGELVVFPFFILLHYTFIQILEKHNIDGEIIRPKLAQLRVFLKCFWVLFFRVENIDSILERHLNNCLGIDCIRLLYLIFRKEDGNWWKEMNDALVILASDDIKQGFQKLYFLASLVAIEDYNWNPFCVMYTHFKLSPNSSIHNAFISLVNNLHYKRSWPLEDNLITSLYNVITTRKFSNFEDEKDNVKLLGKVTSRDSIPNSTFFERFMHLLYSYFSSLPFGANRKRLVTKLFTSSHYYYQKDSKAIGIFINRLNFLNLLLQLSDIDLSSQLADLVILIKDSNDLVVYYNTLQGISHFCEIGSLKKNKLPNEAFSVMMETLVTKYSLLPGIYKLWKRYLRTLDEIFFKDDKLHDTLLSFLNLFKELDLCLISDSLSSMTVDLILKAVTIANKESHISSGEVIIDIMKDNILSYLHIQMGRFPLRSIATENGVNLLVERLIRLCIGLTAISGNQNWNYLALQRFPYIGNVHLRVKFALFFYNELLKVTDIKNYIDNLLPLVLENLAGYMTSPYLCPLINSLIKTKDPLFFFKNDSVQDQITSIQLTNFKQSISCSMISNVYSSPRLSSTTKLNYLQHFFKCLNDEYDKYYLSPSYVDYCKKQITFAQLVCPEYLESMEVYKLLARKLGIADIDLNGYKWRNLPLKEKLFQINFEVKGLLLTKGDVKHLLEKYAPCEDLTLIYHLISIHMKSVANRDNDSWRYIFELLDYVLLKLNHFEISVTLKSFFDFLLLLVDLASLKNVVSNVPSFLQIEVQKYKAFIVAFTILMKANYIYDGFKEKETIRDLIFTFTLSYVSNEQTRRPINLRNPFSLYILFDIQKGTSETGGSNLEDIPTERLEAIKKKAHDKCEQLSSLLRTPEQLPGVAFDIVFFS